MQTLFFLSADLELRRKHSQVDTSNRTTGVRFCALLIRLITAVAPIAQAHTSSGTSKHFRVSYGGCWRVMTKFLLRDGSLIDIDTEASPEDVFSYTNTDGTTIHAALSEQAEMELLRQVPPKLLSVSQRMLLSDLAA